MSKNTIEKIIALVDELPRDTAPKDLDEIMYHLQLKKEIIEGIIQLDQGEGISHDKIKKMAQKWLK